MPKKFSSENTKAVEARARKLAAKEEQEQKKKKAIEEEYWKDDDKNIQKKQQRKGEKEKKKQEQLDKKAEARALYEKELQECKVPSKQPAVKLTRAQIQEENEKRNLAALSSSSKNPSKPKVEEPAPLEENINRIAVEGVEARSVSEAIEALSMDETQRDRHPEKRRKAAYQAFEEKMLPILKAENPSLRHSQLKQMIFTKWQTSPENPCNQ